MIGPELTKIDTIDNMEIGTIFLADDNTKEN